MSEQRKELEKLKQERDRLAAVARAAQVQAEDGRSQAAHFQTPAGIATHTDKQIEQAVTEALSLERAYARARFALTEFENGPGKNLAARFQELDRRELESRYAVVDEQIARWVRKQLEAFRALLASQEEGAELFIARGYRNPLPRVITEKTVAEFKESLCATHRHLLDPDDLIRVRWEGQHGLLPNQRPERVAQMMQEESERIRHAGGEVLIPALTAADYKCSGRKPRAVMPRGVWAHTPEPVISAWEGPRRCARR
jgi:hypothetical protein